MSITRFSSARRRLLQLLVLLLVVVVALAVVADSGPVRSLVLQRIIRAAADSGMVLSAARLDLDLVGASGTLEGLTVGEPGSPPLLTADHLSVALSWKSILRGSFRVTAARLEGAKVHISVDAQGQSNIPLNQRSLSGGSQDPPLEIDAVRIAGDSFVLEDRQRDIDVSLAGWNFTLQGGEAHFDAGSGTVATPLLDGPLQRIVLDGRLDGDSMSISKLDVELEGLRILAQGSLQNFSSPRVDIQAETEFDAERLKLAQPLHGTLGVVAHLDGPLDSVTVDLAVHGQGIAFQNFRGITLDADGTWSSSQQNLNLRSLKLSAPEGTVSLTGAIATAPTTGNHLRGTYRQVDLPRLSQRFGSPIVISSHASGNLAASWNGLNWKEAHVDAKVSLQEISGTLSREALPVSGSLSVRGDRRAGTFLLHDLSALGGRLDGEVDLAFETLEVAGEVHIAADDVARTASNVLLLTGNEAGESVPVSGSVSISSALSGTLRKPRVAYKLQSPALAVYDQNLGRLDAEGTFEEGNVQVARANLTRGLETMTFEGAADFTVPSPHFVVRGMGQNVELASVMSGAPVSGTLGLNLDMSGTIENPSGAFDFLVSDLTVDSTALGTLQGRARLDWPLLRVDHLELSKSNPDAPISMLNAEGTYDFSSSAYKLRGEARGVSIDNGSTQLVLDGQLDGSGTVSSQAEFTVSAELTADATIPESVTISFSAGLQASGNMKNPRGVHASVAIAQAIVHAQGMDIRNEGEVRVSYADDRIDVASGEFRFGDSRVAVEGSLPLERASEAQQLRLNGELALAALQPLLPAESLTSASGTVRLTGTVGGSIFDLKPTLDFATDDAGLEFPWMPTPIAPAAIRGRWRDGTLYLDELRAEGFGAQMEASGSMPVLRNKDSGAGPDSALELSLRGLSLSRTGVFPEGLDGVLSLTARLSSKGMRLADISGIVDVQEMRATYAGVELRQKQAARFVMDGGRIRVEDFELLGPHTALAVFGDINLEGSRELNLDARGTLDAELLTPWLGSSSGVAGEAALTVQMRGPMAAPELSGKLDLERGSASVKAPSIRVEDMKLGLDLVPGRIAIRDFSGRVNGGTFSATGSVSYSLQGIESTDIELSARNVFEEFPAGMKTLSDLDISLRGSDVLQVGGEVRIHSGAYSRDIDYGDLLRAVVSGAPAPALPEAPNPLLTRLRLNVAVKSVSPLLIDNNLGRVAADADLRLVGTYYRLGVTGRISLRPGGSMQFSGNRYVLEKGNIDFANTSGIRPVFDIDAQTRLHKTVIDVNLRGGGAEKLAVNLQSPTDPDLAQEDLTSLLLTGRTREQLRGNEGTFLAQQSLALLTGGLASGITGNLASNMRRNLGTSVRLEPNLITAESDPSPRLSVQQEFSPQVSLLYSINVTDSADKIWILEYGLNRFSARAIRQQDNTTRGELSHSTSFGGDSEPSARRTEAVKIFSVELAGETGLPAEQLKDKLKSRAGKPYNVITIGDDEERVLETLRKSGYLEARVQTERNLTEESAALTFHVESGAIVKISYDGYAVTGDLMKRVQEIWQEGYFDAQRLEDARAEILGFMSDRGYVQASVADRVETGEGVGKSVHFMIAPGTHFSESSVEFDGNLGLTTKELERALRPPERRHQLHTDPESLATYLTELYQVSGYLDANVGPIRSEVDAERQLVRFVVPIDEGPLYRIRDTMFQGNQAADATSLREIIGFSAGQVYRPQFARYALNRIEEHYLDLAYYDVIVNFTVTRESGAGTVLLNFEIEENNQSVVQNVQVSGNALTSANLIRDELVLKSGDPLKADKVAQARTNLYDTGSFSLVDIETRPLGEKPASGPVPVELQVNVREVRPFEFRYGGFYDSDSGIGAIADFVSRNTIGNARSIGSRLRYDGDTKEARVYLTQPFLQRFALQSTLMGYAQEEKQGDFKTRKFGVSAQQQTWWSDKRYTLSFGARYEWVRSVDITPSLADAFPGSRDLQRVAPLTFSFARETRDEILDAARGSFASAAFEYAPKFLGSAEEYIRLSVQTSRYIALKTPRLSPLGGDPPKPRFVYAVSGRAGWGWGLRGSEVPFSQRFFTGGGTSIRGFKQDSVGPAAPTGEALGGDAIFVLNNEIRFPMVSWLDAAGFLDAGNTYATARDFDPFRLRASSGLGVRFRIPHLVFRFDYGWKLGRRDGESPGAFFFSIGQAF